MGGALTDAFGTRLTPSALVAGLDALGLGESCLVVDDAGVVLECADPDPRRDDVARALTWLRTQFSPLVSARLAALRADAPRFVDARQRGATPIALAEVFDPDTGFDGAVDELIERLGDVARGATTIALPDVEDALHQGLAERLARAVERRVGEPVTLSVLLPPRKGPRVVGRLASSDAGDGLHLLMWVRPGAERGVRQAVYVAASRGQRALLWLASSLSERSPRLRSDEPDVLLDGLVWGVARRPTVAARADATTPIRVDPDRCTSCTTCEAICPTGYLGPDGLPKLDDPGECIRCYDCVEACPVDALRPTYDGASAMLASALSHRPTWLSRLAGAQGAAFPAPFPPSYLLPRTDAAPPRYVLGLAIVTMQEHAAVLLKDGAIVGAIEHERLVRLRHAGWHPPDRPGVTLAVDPTLCLEEALCRRPIRALLEQEGITLDDVDLFAVNGLHGRYRHAFSFIDPEQAIPTLRAGRVVFVPHHLCHAASAYRLSGARDAWVLTMDGRGDRECAAIFRAEAGSLRCVDTVLALTDRSIGGVYEGVTRLLGFGDHGQGTVMALAPFGSPRYDFRGFLGVSGTAESIHETGIDDRFAAERRVASDAPGPEHQDLAASLQLALEQAAVALLARNIGDAKVDNLCVAGGVALNCRMNERLRQHFAPRSMFVQPGANDAGTAIGAALEALHIVRPDLTQPRLEHSYLGPRFDDAAIERVIRRAGLRYRHCDSIANEAAARISEGQIVCWFQGAMEFGPRALGARSILADPRRPDIHDRANRVKQREPWRPFGPSILAGHEAEWLEHAFDARFMVFTLGVLPEQRARIPAVVHVDGSTRPQIVHREHAPRYHELIEAFHRITGVPMVLNTSFNRRGEPIVCTPDDAVRSFLGLGADALAIGSFLVEPERDPALFAEPFVHALAELPGGRRLSMRLTSRCDLDCGHCTVRDLRRYDDRALDGADRALADGRRAGCDELVVLRGEAALRADLPQIVRRARAMGYRFVQLQTNAHALSDAHRLGALLQAGVDAFDVMLLAADEATHDELSGSPGTFAATLGGLRALARSGRQVLLDVPVLAGNVRRLGSIAQLAKKLGAARIQFAFPRPVELDDRVVTDPVPRLAYAAHFVRQAARLATELGLVVSTEAFPFCHLPESLRRGPESEQDWMRHRIDDLHLVHEAASDVRRSQRPDPPPCRSCSARDACPRTWALYLELFGSEELTPL